MPDRTPGPNPPRSRGASYTPLRFVAVFGVVSLLADFVYEGARSVTGPYLATLGASAALVGLVTGAGEAVALVFRLGSGMLADRTGRRWALSGAGYAITLLSVPLLALTTAVGSASALIVSERFGKAVRTPARDTMLAQATASMGRGRGFGLHEALDQVGALAGPLLVALVLALGGGYHAAFGLLAVPGLLAAVAFVREGGIRFAAPLFGLARPLRIR
jgi:MFS family permease